MNVSVRIAKTSFKIFLTLLHRHMEIISCHRNKICSMNAFFFLQKNQVK